MKRAAKITGFTVGGIIGFLSILFILLVSGVFNPLIIQTISKNAGSFINGEIAISKLNGNIFSHFILEKVEISSENKNLVLIEQAEIKYRLFPVLHKKIEIDSVKINGLQVFLEEDENQKWNIEKLIKSTDEVKTDTTTTPFEWEIELKLLELKPVETFIKTSEKTSIPEYAGLNVALDFFMNSTSTKVNVGEFDLQTRNPEFTVQKLAFNFQKSEQNLNWQNLLLKLPNSLIHSEGTVPLDSLFTSQIHLTATPFSFEDLNAWIPGFYGNPEINFTLQTENKKNKIDLQIDVPGQKLTVNGDIAGTGKLPEYNLEIKADSVNGEYWFHNPELNSIINGELQLSGHGTDFRQNSLQMLANFKNIKYDVYEFSGILLDLNKEKGNISGNLKAGTFLGNVSSQFKIDELFGIPAYNIEAVVNRLNLAKLTGDKRLKSELNLGIKAKGEGIKPEDLTTSIQIFSKNSSLFEQPVSDFNTLISAEKGNYNLHEFRIETPYLFFALNGNGNVTSKNNLNFDFEIKNTQKIASVFSEKELDIQARIKGNISGPSNNLSLNSELTLPWFLYDSVRIENATAKIESRIVGNKLSMENISNDLLVYQQNLNPEKLFLKAETQIGKAEYKNYSLSDFILDFEKNNKNLMGTLSVKTLEGNIQTAFNITELFTDPEFTIQSDLTHLNIKELAGDKNLSSDLNLKMSLKGNGNSLETLNAEISLESKNSTIQEMPVTDFTTRAFLNNKNYNLTSFVFETPLASLKAAAEGDIHNKTNISFQLVTNDFKNNIGRFNLSDLEIKGGIEGFVSGKPDSLQLQALINFENFKYDTIQADKILANTKFLLRDSIYSGTLHLLSQNLKIQELEIKEIKFDSDINNGTANSVFSFFASDSLNGKVRTVLVQNQNPVLYFPEIDFNIDKNHWQNVSDSGYINLGLDSIQIHQFSLQSAESSVEANGIFSFHGNEDLHLEIKNLNLINIPGLQLLPYKLSGIINANSRLTGNADSPVFSGFIEVNSPAVDSLKLSKLYTAVQYEEKKLVVKSYIDDNTKRLITADAEIPLDFTFSDDLNTFIKTTPVYAQIKLNELDINQFNRFIPVKGTNINGNLSLDVTLSNTLENLFAEGKIQLENGAIDYSKLGINYRNITLNSRFNNHEFNLDSLSLSSGNGKLALKGNAALHSFIQLPDNCNFQLDGTNFRAFNSELIKAFIDTRLTVSGNPENPVFSGNMMINRATFNTDIFLREYNRVYDTSEEPLLVQVQKNEISVNTVKKTETDTLKKPPPDIYKNLKGQFDIQIPGNTWIKGKNMNFEVSGNLKVLKEREQIDLFGNMQVKRGFYKIYGKKLDFEEGEITLTGGQTIDPNINFVIGYKFRDPDKTLRKLNITIKGKVSQPEISFALDDSEIEEKDAVSYLIFNKSLAQLDTRENSTVAGTNLDMAKDLALVQVTNLVKDALQSTIGLDVIEFSGIKGGTEGSVSVGKYITNNLFLNYERNFALDKKNKLIEPEKISLEYQIMRSLFLQATNQKTNSGFDFIFKWTWK